MLYKHDVYTWLLNKAFLIIILILHRSSDSEEAFETPESTTPVKSVPPIPIVALPEVQEQQPQLQQELEEICLPPPKPEEPGIDSTRNPCRLLFTTFLNIANIDFFLCSMKID